MNEKHLYLIPHMDDEVISMGISIMRNAPSAHLLIVTNGGPRYGEDFFVAKGYVNRDHYMHVRKAETTISAKLLGISDANIRFLGVTDQETHYHLPFIIDSIVMYAHEHKITTLHTFCYEGNHPDHDVVRFATWFASQIIGAKLIEYSNNLVRKRKYEIPSAIDFQKLKPSAQEKALKKKILSLVYKSQNLNLNRYKTREYFKQAVSNDFSILKEAKSLRYERISLIKIRRKDILTAFSSFISSNSIRQF